MMEHRQGYPNVWDIYLMGPLYQLCGESWRGTSIPSAREDDLLIKNSSAVPIALFQEWAGRLYIRGDLLGP
jgi:hypothetical protein